MAYLLGEQTFINAGIWHYLVLAFLHAFIAIATYLFLFLINVKYYYAIIAALPPLFGTIYSINKLGNFLRGKDAENKVISALLRLDDRYRIIRNYRYAGGDIDVVVVGPSGVTVFEVKKVRGKVVSNREGVWYGKRNFYEQLLKGVKFLQSRLPEFAKEHVKWAVIVDGGKIERKFGGKTVLRYWDAPRFVKRGKKLSEEEINEIMEALT